MVFPMRHTGIMCTLAVVNCARLFAAFTLHVDDEETTATAPIVDKPPASGLEELPAVNHKVGQVVESRARGHRRPREEWRFHLSEFLQVDQATRRHRTKKAYNEPKEGHEKEEEEEEEEEEGATHLEQIEEHEEPTPVSDAVSCMLLGMICFQMALFYMVRYRDEYMQTFVWYCISATISIFCAVLLFGTVKATLFHKSHEAQEEEERIALGQTPTLEDIKYSFFLWAGLFIFLQAILFPLRHADIMLKATSCIGAHILGFAAIDVFAMFQQTAAYRESTASLFQAAVISGAVMIGSCLVFTTLRKLIDNTADTDEWRTECQDCEDEFCGFVLGMLMRNVVVRHVTGDTPPVHGDDFGKTPKMVSDLGAICGGMAVFILFSTLVVGPLKHMVVNGVLHRTIDIILECVSMCFGWSCISLLGWKLWSNTNDKGIAGGELIVARVVLALGCSFLVFFSVLVSGFLFNAINSVLGREIFTIQGTKALCNAFGLLLGLSWEGAFGEAIGALGRRATTPENKFMVMNGLGICLCVIVLPAWVLYVLPDVHAIKEEEEDIINIEELEGLEEDVKAKILKRRRGSARSVSSGR
eukprot:TRINITY_DN9360_c1_g1_i1.p1 TRINITY_DN9360_c1_g1~~TRINITY_DN9360_c1_g1_i1.p1  ORF type:complete len:586 (-),score=137.08 TRINITY_DN9360_c1_g1_i1:55-1812(-)